MGKIKDFLKARALAVLASGVGSLLKSRKFWITAAGVAGVILAKRSGLPPETAAEISKAILVLVAILVPSIALEDAAKNLNGKKAKPKKKK